MEGFLGVVIFIVVMFVIYKVRQLSGRAASAAWNNTIQRGANEKGKRLTQLPLTFTANAPVEAVRNAVLATVKAQPEAPKVIGALYLAGVSNTRIVYDMGSKVQTGFRGVLDLAATPTGTRGSWVITNWLEYSGLVTGRDAMEKLIADINTGLRSVDPNARLQ